MPAFLPDPLFNECRYSFFGSGEELLLLDDAGNSRGSLNDFVRAQSGREGHHSVSMKGYFIGSEVGPLPLHSIEYDLAIHELRQPFSIEAKETAKAVVEDVLAHTTKYVKDAPT